MKGKYFKKQLVQSQIRPKYKRILQKNDIFFVNKLQYF